MVGSRLRASTIDRSTEYAEVKRRVEETWDRSANVIACLSVRSGFDLLLKSLNFAPGSEVLVSALTIWDIPKIIEEHRLVPVPIDLDVETLGPNFESFRRAISSKTRAVVVAHSCGGRVSIEPIVARAREHGLVVIEDCARRLTAGRS